VQDNLDKINLVAMVVANLAILYFGQRFYAVTSLGVLAIGVLKRQNCLPSYINSAYSILGSISIAGYGFANSGIYGRIVLSGFTAHRIYTYFFSAQAHGKRDFFSPSNQTPKVLFSESEPPSKLTEAQLGKLLKGEARVKLNRDHLLIDPYPVAKEPSFENLARLVDSFDWKKFQGSNFKSHFVEKLAIGNTGIWCQDWDGKVAAAKMKLRNLLEKVEKEEFPYKMDYKVLKNYLGLISEDILILSPEIQMHVLTCLLGYHENVPNETNELDVTLYYGSTENEKSRDYVYQSLEAAASSVITANLGKFPLRQRVLFLLQQMRLTNLKTIIQVMTENKPELGDILGEKLETLRRFTSLVETDFGLPDIGLIPHPLMNPTQATLFRYMYGLDVNHLWNTYTPDLINLQVCSYSEQLRCDEWLSQRNITEQKLSMEDVMNAILVECGILSLED
jgi:hypothetical protein